MSSMDSQQNEELAQSLKQLDDTLDALEKSCAEDSDEKDMITDFRAQVHLSICPFIGNANMIGELGPEPHRKLLKAAGVIRHRINEFCTELGIEPDTLHADESEDGA